MKKVAEKMSRKIIKFVIKIKIKSNKKYTIWQRNEYSIHLYKNKKVSVLKQGAVTDEINREMISSAKIFIRLLFEIYQTFSQDAKEIK